MVLAAEPLLFCADYVGLTAKRRQETVVSRTPSGLLNLYVLLSELPA